MTHDDVIDRLPELAGRALPADVEAHLLSCDACLAHHDAWAAMREAVDIAGMDAHRRRPVRALAALAAAAAVTIILAAAVRAGGGESTTVLARPAPDAQAAQPDAAELERPPLAADPSACDLSGAPVPDPGPHPTVTWEVDGNVQQARGVSDLSSGASVSDDDGLAGDHFAVDGDHYFAVPEERRHLTDGKPWVRWRGQRMPEGWSYLQLSPDPTRYLEALRSHGVEVDCVGREEVRGVTTARYLVRSRPFSAAALGRSMDVVTELWIDASGRPRRVRTTTHTVARPMAPEDRRIAQEVMDRSGLPAAALGDADGRSRTVSVHEIVDYGHGPPMPIPADHEVFDVRTDDEAIRLATGTSRGRARG